jgi:hypothetical protein
MRGKPIPVLERSLIICIVALLMPAQGTVASPLAHIAMQPADVLAPVADMPLVLAGSRQGLSSRTNIRRLPPQSGLSNGARIQSLKGRIRQGAKDPGKTNRRNVAPSLGASRFEIDRSRIDNRGLATREAEGSKQALQKRLERERLRTGADRREITRKQKVPRHANPKATDPGGTGSGQIAGASAARKAEKMRPPQPLFTWGSMTVKAEGRGALTVPKDGDGFGKARVPETALIVPGLFADPLPPQAAGWINSSWGRASPRGRPKSFQIISAGVPAGRESTSDHAMPPSLEFPKLTVTISPQGQPPEIPFLLAYGDLDGAGAAGSGWNPPTVTPSDGDQASLPEAGDQVLVGFEGSDPGQHGRGRNGGGGLRSDGELVQGVGAGTSSNEVSVEELTIVHEGFERARPKPFQITTANDGSTSPRSTKYSNITLKRGLTATSDPYVAGSGGVPAHTPDWTNPIEGDPGSGGFPQVGYSMFLNNGTPLRAEVPVSPIRPQITLKRGYGPMRSAVSPWRLTSAAPMKGPGAETDILGAEGSREGSMEIITFNHEIVAPRDLEPVVPTGNSGAEAGLKNRSVFKSTSGDEGDGASAGTGHGVFTNGLSLPAGLAAGRTRSGLMSSSAPGRGGNGAASAQPGQTSMQFLRERAARLSGTGPSSGIGDPDRPIIAGRVANLGGTQAARPEQSLYFPETMLTDISGAAAGIYDYPGDYAQRFDGVSPDLPQLMTVRGWNYKTKETVSGEADGTDDVPGVTHRASRNAGGRLLAHEATHTRAGTGPRSPSPVPTPYPNMGHARGDGAQDRPGKPLLIIAEDIEGEYLGLQAIRVFFRWTL